MFAHANWVRVLANVPDLPRERTAAVTECTNAAHNGACEMPMLSWPHWFGKPACCTRLMQPFELLRSVLPGSALVHFLWQPMVQHFSSMEHCVSSEQLTRQMVTRPASGLGQYPGCTGKEGKRTGDLSSHVYLRLSSGVWIAQSNRQRPGRYMAMQCPCVWLSAMELPISL